MDIKVRAMTPEERKYSYTQDADTMHHSGCIGHLRVDMDTNGTGFYSSWDDHNANLKTQEFKDQFDEVIHALRFDEQYGGILKNRSSLASYCYKTPESNFGNDREFGFRVDTEEYSYLLRLSPNKGEYAAYIYAYDRDLLDGALLPEPEMMTVLVVEPGQPPYVKLIQTGMESLCRELDAETIQAVYPYEDDLVGLICDDNGKNSQKPLNRALRDENGHIYDVIAGTFLVAGLGEESFTSLTQEQADKFKELFRTPETFIQMNGNIYVVPQKIEPSFKDIPVYPHSVSYAAERNESEQYRASYKANVACKKAIEDAIADNYRGWSLDGKTALAQITEQFNMERVQYVLAATVRFKAWDGRFSEENKRWAENVPVGQDRNTAYFVVDQAHPGLTNLLVNQVRQEYAERKPSVLEKIKSAPQKSVSKKPPHSKGQER